MTQNKIAKILIQTIIKELGGKLNGQENRSLGARKDRQHGKAVSRIANNC